jgi:hypothetical protein
MARLEAKDSRQSELNDVGQHGDSKDVDKTELYRPLFGDDSPETAAETDAPQTRPEWTEEEKREKQLESGWSDDIMDSIRSLEEYNIYREAGVVETEIAGRPCLIRNDFDSERVDAMGRTNKERMEYGLAPLTNEGKPIELHHIGQKADSPLAELTMEEHRGKGNDTILHDKTVESEIDRNQFNMEKADHWKNRT